MSHEEIEELLGAYALDAVEPAEAGLIEAHLAECPRCRAELKQHREVAALLGNAGAEAPPDLWDRIASHLESEPPNAAVATAIGLGASGRQGARRRRGLVFAPLAGLAAAAAVVVAVLSFQLAHLDNEVHTLQSATSGLSTAVSGVLAGPHRTIELASADRRLAATVVVAPSGQAYWLSSNLADLPATMTYQVWGTSAGHPVSLGLLGPDAATLWAFRVGPATAAILVTAEPSGGTQLPTSPAIVRAGLTTSA